MEAAKNVAASQVRMTDTSILTQNVTTFIKNSVNFENIFCQGWSPLRISAKLPLIISAVKISWDYSCSSQSAIS